MSHPIPTEITLRQKSRRLDIAFADGKAFQLPCEYLRVFSRAADHRALDAPVIGKERVNVVNIEPQGEYGLRLYFDDGHDTGIFSFATLYELGLNQDANWSAYLRRLEAIGHRRETRAQGDVTVTVLLFAWLARLLESDEETVTLADGRHTVADVLANLRRKQGRWAEWLRDDQVDIEIAAQPVTLYTTLRAGDEVVIIPKSPVAPA